MAGICFCSFFGREAESHQFVKRTPSALLPGSRARTRDVLATSTSSKKTRVAAMAGGPHRDGAFSGRPAWVTNRSARSCSILLHRGAEPGTPCETELRFAEFGFSTLQGTDFSWSRPRSQRAMSSGSLFRGYTGPRA
jgi:hypothetical protein